MKKIILSAFTLVTFGFANAQDSNGGHTSKGKFLIEANTGFGAITAANTSLGYSSQGDVKQMSIGAEGGYFVMDNLAVKLGLGYNSEDNGTTSESGFAYKIGAKYYVMGNIPVQLDYTGASGDSYKVGSETPSYVGVQAGYAIFLGQNVSIEPGVRYNSSLNDKYTKDGQFQLQVGFALHF